MRCYLFEPLCEVVECIDDAVIIDDLVCVDGVIAATGAQDAVDELCLSSTGRLGERMEKILCGGLKCGGRV